MNTKYPFEFSEEVLNRNIIRLTNQIWKLIPMFEHEENWQKQLETVIIEITGLNEIFLLRPQFLQILSKLEGLKAYSQLEFPIYRKTVFEVISLLSELKNG